MCPVRRTRGPEAVVREIDEFSNKSRYQEPFQSFALMYEPAQAPHDAQATQISKPPDVRTCGHELGLNTHRGGLEDALNPHVRNKVPQDEFRATQTTFLMDPLVFSSSTLLPHQLPLDSIRFSCVL